ncbi:unnamed protein product [Trichogramma brassicae]|uniref:Uncharacterized protein n=1 Tax=Trichogramma brassicae TaxID=86971 RepID=A0A6H5IXU4_9HYME|nr:unnamed protein product [Trichogramma brassicae]
MAAAAVPHRHRSRPMLCPTCLRRRPAPAGICSFRTPVTVLISYYRMLSGMVQSLLEEFTTKMSPVRVLCALVAEPELQSPALYRVSVCIAALFSEILRLEATQEKRGMTHCRRRRRCCICKDIGYTRRGPEDGSGGGSSNSRSSSREGETAATAALYTLIDSHIFCERDANSALVERERDRKKRKKATEEEEEVEAEEQREKKIRGQCWKNTIEEDTHAQRSQESYIRIGCRARSGRAYVELARRHFIDRVREKMYIWM